MLIRVYKISSDVIAVRFDDEERSAHMLYSQKKLPGFLEMAANGRNNYAYVDFSEEEFAALKLLSSDEVEVE